MHILSIVFVTLVVVILLFKLYLNYRQVCSIKKHINEVPEIFRRSINLEQHKKSGYYNLAKLNLNFAEEIFASFVLIMFTLGGGLEFINNKVDLLTINSLTKGLIVILVYGILNYILTLPFSIYATFGIEQKFGFNNTSIGLFIADLIKVLVLATLIGTPLVYLVLWLMGVMGSLWWVYVWGVLIGFNLLILVIYPTLIAPIFNKFKPLEDVVLRNRINRLLEKCGFKSSGVFVMDGSKRSSHGNAYFTGLGNAKRIVFFDTLVKQLSHSETEAVLAHELGHFKKKHVLKQMIVYFGLMFGILYVLSRLIDSSLLYNALGVTTIATCNGLILFVLLMGVVSLPFAPLFSYFSRKNEFEADEFAAKNTNKRCLISGLVKLYRDNATTLTPDPLYVKFYYSHPPSSLRIAHLESLN